MTTLINKYRLRLRFLLVRVAICAGLTAAVVLIVRFSFGAHATRQISNELRHCQERYQALQAQTDTMLRQAAAILAESAAVREVPKEKGGDARQELSKSFAERAGIDLVVFFEGNGKVAALRTATPNLPAEDAERLLAGWRDADSRDSYWFFAGKLYRVHRQSAGSPVSTAERQGVLVAGTELGPRVASQLGAMCSCDVAFEYGDAIVASTIGSARLSDLASQLPNLKSEIADRPASLRMGKEQFSALYLPLALSSPSPGLIVLKSHEATRLLQLEFTKLMLALAVVAMIIGFSLVLRVSDTFARPLGNLVQAVRALEKGDFSYPVKVRSNDELAEVTQAFDQMRASLRDTQQELLRSERLATVGRMASSISHDLRHPLTAIVANSEFLSEDGVGPEQRQGLHQEIQMAVEQMNDLIESLLEFSRGRESPHIVRVRLEDVIERAVHTVRARPEFQAVAISVSCPNPIECAIDPLKIQRALSNLLINACEALAGKSGRIEVSLTERKDLVEIRVIDDGPGIPDAVRETLFQPFVSHGKSNGTGLGLAAVRKICRDHGGDAVLESSQPGRTAFKLSLPCISQ
jgi:signal transduction histidine kinase